MRASREKHHTSLSTRTVFLLTLLLSTLVLSVGLTWDFGYDQGTFAYGGKAILEGARPYLDFWDIKPPNIFYTYATALGFFGNSVFAVRLFDLINALVTIVLLFTLALKLWTGTPWGRLAAVMTCVTYVLHYFIFGFSETAQAETYSIPWILVAVLLILPERETETKNQYAKLFIAGFALAIAFFFKYPNGVFLALALAMLWINTGKQQESHLKQAFILVTGFGVSFGLQVLYLQMTGGLSELWHIMTSATLHYSSSNVSGNTGVLWNLRTALFNLDLLWVVVAIIGWSFWGTDLNNRIKHTNAVFQSSMTLLLACVLALFAIQIQNKLYTYHYTILLPWAELLIGAGLAHMILVLRQIDTLPRSSNTIIVVLVLFVGSYLWTSSRVLHTRIEEVKDVFAGRRAPNGSQASDELANYIIKNTKPEDRIFIFGFHPYAYWKSGRKPANRFINTIHFKPSYVEQEAKDELVKSLTANPPAVFLVETEDHYTSQGDNRDDSRTTIQKSYPEIELLLQTNYSVRDTLSGVICYFLQPNSILQSNSK